MSTVGIDELRRRLSELIREVEGGATVLVTRHNRPVVQLTAANPLRGHKGSRFGVGQLGPAVEKGSQGAYLRVLEEDRRGAPE